MVLDIQLSKLPSRAIRIASVGSAGIRRIAVNATSTQENDEGTLKNVYDALTKFGAGLIRGVLNVFGRFLQFSWSKIWGFMVQSYFFIMNFNWNATNVELDAQIKQAEIGVAAARGRLKGQSLGFAICGLIPSATIAVFNEPMALYILQELGEEAAEEISASLASLVQLQIRQQAQKAFINLYKNHRALIRGGVTAVASFLVATGKLTQASVDKLNKKRNEPWTFAGAFDDSIDSITDPAEKAETEEFYDELQDACIEAGYIVAGGVDAYFASQKIANNSFFGRQRLIEITPNRALDNPFETISTP